MFTLRLILKGVIFLTIVKGASGRDQLWLLMLDPGYKTAVHHQAQLYVDPQSIDDSSRRADGEGHGKSYFDLSGDHLTLNFANPAQPASLFFSQKTKAAGKMKPCFDCGSIFTFRQQKDDIQWVNTLSEILKAVNLNDGHTLAEGLELREDIFLDEYAADGLILSRIVVGQGEIRTYTLWDEEDDPFNTSPDKISTYAFKDPSIACDPGVDPHVAVAQSIAIELTVKGLITFNSRSLAEKSKSGRGSIVLKKGAGGLVEVQISSMNHAQGPRDGDFKSFYAMLKHPEYFMFLPIPKECRAADSGGACSPARP